MTEHDFFQLRCLGLAAGDVAAAALLAGCGSDDETATTATTAPAAEASVHSCVLDG